MIWSILEIAALAALGLSIAGGLVAWAICYVGAHHEKYKETD